MFGIGALLTTPILGALAIALALGLGGTALHTWGLPFLGLKGVSGQLTDAESARDSCLNDINNPMSGWAVRFKAVSDNETRLKSSLDEIDKMTKADKAESDRRDAEASANLAALRQRNASLDQQVRRIRAQVPMGTAGDIARQAEMLVLESLNP